MSFRKKSLKKPDLLTGCRSLLLTTAILAASFGSLTQAQSVDNTLNPRVKVAEVAYARGDYEIALSNWTALANDGDAEAKYFIGMLHEFGKGTPPDLRKAYQWYLEAAKSENARAQFKIGEIYENGNNGNADIGRAIKWWQRSADNGYASAKLKLGWAYYNGIGVAQDRDRAARLIAGVRSSKSNDVSDAFSSQDQTDFVSQIKQDDDKEKIQIASIGTIGNPSEITQEQTQGVAQGITQGVGETTLPADTDVFTVDVPTDVVSSNLTNANRLMTLAPGTSVKIIARAGKRALVRVPGGVPLWVFGQYINDKGLITGEAVRVRPLPSTASNAAPLGNLKRGERVRVLSRQNGWAKIIAPERISAWINIGVAKTPATVVAAAAPASVAVAKPKPVLNTTTQTSGFGKTLRKDTVVLALPTPNASKLISLRKGTPLKLLDRKGGWYRVAIPGGLPIWVYGKYVEVQANNRGRLSGKGVRARALPSTGKNATVVGSVGSGELVQIIGQKDAWYYVRGPERITGWIRSDQIQTGVNNNASEWQAFAQIVANDAFTRFEREF